LLVFVRGSCYSVATEPQHWSTINGGSQKVLARWLEDRKKKWSGSQVGRAERPGAQVVFAQVTFAQISFSRNEVSAQAGVAGTGEEEERVEIDRPQVFGEEVLAQAFSVAQERASRSQGCLEGREQDREARQVRSSPGFARRQRRRRAGQVSW
jgi:hypothetical protein